MINKSESRCAVRPILLSLIWLQTELDSTHPITITYFLLSYIYDFNETVQVYRSYKFLFASVLILAFINYHMQAFSFKLETPKARTANKLINRKTNKFS